MREDSIKRFLVALGVDYEGIEEARGWVNCRCVLAPFTHGAGVDKHPSFGISINDEKKSVYYCFGCSPEPKFLSDLLHTVYVLTGSYPWEAARIYGLEENFGDVEEEEEEPTVPDVWERKAVEQPFPLPNKVLRQYPLLAGATGYEARKCRAFLEQTRHIDEEVWQACGVRYDNHSSALIFPMTDKKGDIYLLRARDRRKKSIWTISPTVAGFPDLEFPRLKYIGAWFGLHLIDWKSTLMAVEGAEDVLRVKTLGFSNVIGSCTSSLSGAQIRALRANRLILGYDSDAGGKFAHRRIRERVNCGALLELDWSIVKKSDGEPCKDGGDLINKADLNLVIAEAKIL